ncbi:MAG: sporulation integral membrane protein YtvI [Lachnospiraceae bacterium]|nr:sporulation integral membrane protein YtvI [Lachnospiraceae bacterium]
MRVYGKAVVNLVVSALILLITIFLVPKAIMYMLPFVVGWVISMIAAPLVKFFEEKLKIKRKTGSAVIIILVLALVITLSYIVLTILFDQLMGLINSLPSVWSAVEKTLNNTGDKWAGLYNRLPRNAQDTIKNINANVGGYVGSFLKNLSTPTVAVLGNMLKQVPNVFIGVIMTLISSYLFVAERGAIQEWFEKHTSKRVQEYFQVIKEGFSRAVGGYFKAQFLIEIWVFLVTCIGLLILRIDFAILIALGVAFLDLLPVFGAGMIMIPWALLRLASGDYFVGIGLLVVWGLGQFVRQLIQPKIVGDSVGVPAIPTLLLLYVGYKVASIGGMIIAVPVGLICMCMYEAGMFKTTKDSISILVKGINDFRRFNKKDLLVIEEESLDLPTDDGADAKSDDDGNE